MWTLEQGVLLVCTIQQESRQFGYHVCLGGGVINAGYSDKDVDIYMLPLDHDQATFTDADGAIEWLESLWGPSAKINQYPMAYNGPYAHKLKFKSPAGRIDLFIMKGLRCTTKSRSH